MADNMCGKFICPVIDFVIGRRVCRLIKEIVNLEKENKLLREELSKYEGDGK